MFGIIGLGKEAFSRKKLMTDRQTDNRQTTDSASSHKLKLIS